MGVRMLLGSLPELPALIDASALLALRAPDGARPCAEGLGRALAWIGGQRIPLEEALSTAASRFSASDMDWAAHALGMSGSGHGYGSVDGSGSGDSYGSGYDDGYGSGYGCGCGYGYGCGYDDGSGYGYDDGYDDGYGGGCGYGYGCCYDDGSGYGSGYGYDDGSGYGYDDGYDDGYE